MEHTQPKNFVDVFNDAITKLEIDAKAIGSNMTEVCREAGVSRTTPDRWKEKPPATVATLAKLQDFVSGKAEQKANE